MEYKKEDKELKRAKQQVVENMQIPVGSADVKEMITQKLYADKTSYIAKLFRTNGIYYFFIRPRRFGKSLLLDTIDQIAKGNKELFKNCSIYKNQTYQWKKYPVIWLNFSKLAKDSSEKLQNNLIDILYSFAKNYAIDRNEIDPIIGEPTVEGTLEKLINALKKLGNSYEPTPIILIDEYDSPLISCEKEQYEAVLSVLSSFFKVLKGIQKDCKFIFVTGVTKFHLSGLTSGANSAKDISLDNEYGAMLGYTEEEIDNLFFKGKKNNIQIVIENLKSECGKDEDYTSNQLKQELKDYYNGYYFTRGAKESVYNPDSILKFFYAKDFENFWFNSGNPTILLQQMKQNIDRFNMDWDQCSFPIHKIRFKLVHPSLHKIPILPLMYQTGYLTLDPNGFTNDPSRDKNATDYYLRFPNGEVKSALKLILSDFIAQKQQEAGRAYRDSILDDLRIYNWSAFFNRIRSACLAKAGYRFLDKSEKSFQGALYSFLNGAFHTTHDTEASAERDSAIGRTDIVMEDQHNNERTIYVFELKVDKPALEALNQIHNKDYSIQYDLCHKKVLIGLKCDPVKLNITEAAIEVHQCDEQHTFKVVSRKIFIINPMGYFQELA